MRKPFYWTKRKAWYIRVPNSAGKLTAVKLGESRTEAYDAWDALRRKAELPPAPDLSKSLTVLEVLGLYALWLEQRGKLEAIEEFTVTRRIERVAPFGEHVGDLLVTEVKPHHVTSWLASQSTWGATTRSDAAKEVKSAMRWAAREGIIDRDPLVNVKPESPLRREYTISKPEYDKLLAEVWKHRGRRGVTCFRSILIALQLSGCRPSEILSLDVADFDGETWTIKRHKNRKKQHPRVVYLSPCLQTLSRIHAGDRTSGPLFRPAPDRTWQYSEIRRRFERLKKRAGIDSKCVLYSFRHTWITEAMRANVDVAFVAEMAGTSIQMIDRHYGHLRQNRQHMIDAAKKILAAKVAG